MEKIKNCLKKFLKPSVIIIMISILLAIISDVYLLVLDDKIQVFLRNIIANLNIYRILSFSIVYSIIGLIIHYFKNELYKFRYLIIMILLLIGVGFQISGSSIGCFEDYFAGIDDTDGILLGKSRNIRTDEWAVNTPFSFSQEYDKIPYSYESNTIRGTATDVFIIYGQPIYSPLMIYRIFQIGYILFGPSVGLSFFWVARFLALFIVSFELMMIISKKNKRLSFIGATMIVLAPIVQWWFAINGLIELLVSGSLAIILLDKYMKDSKFLNRCIYLLGLIVCAGTYILVFYPAWQIPLAYVYLILAIWVILENKEKFQIGKKDFISIIIAIIILGGSLGYVLVNSYSTISTTINTVYPGNIIRHGGNDILRYFSYPSNIFYSVDINLLKSNVCEQSVFFDLFPVGLLLSLYILHKHKNKDKLLIGLIIISVFFGIWMIIGYPNIIEKISLLSRTTTIRAYLAIGFINILMLIRSLAIMEKSFDIKKSFLFSVFLAIMVFGFASADFYEYFLVGYKLYLIIPLLALLFFGVLNYKTKHIDKIFTFSITITLIFTSLLVNPIRTSADFIYNSALLKDMKNINDGESGLWIMESVDFPKNNLLIMEGIPTINSTNVYPALDRWRSIDKNGYNEDVYNRYSHITIVVNDELQEPQFKLLYPDQFMVSISIKDLYEKLNVKYIFTSNSIIDNEEDNIKVDKIYNNYGYNVYKLEKNN